MEKQNYAYISIVAIVAIVALVVLMSGNRGSYVLETQNSNLAGQGYRTMQFPSPLPCNDTDGGINFTLKGTVSGRIANTSTGYEYTDSCSDNFTILTEWYCVSDDYPAQVINDCTENYGYCWDGECLGTPTNSTCIDSDGNNWYTAGNVTYNNYTVYDHCVGNLIQEAICMGNNLGWVGGECQNGCSNGKCLNTIIDKKALSIR